MRREHTSCVELQRALALGDADLRVDGAALLAHLESCSRCRATAPELASLLRLRDAFEPAAESALPGFERPLRVGSPVDPPEMSRSKARPAFNEQTAASSLWRIGVVS